MRSRLPINHKTMRRAITLSIIQMCCASTQHIYAISPITQTKATNVADSVGTYQADSIGTYQVDSIQPAHNKGLIKKVIGYFRDSNKPKSNKRLTLALCLVPTILAQLASDWDFLVQQPTLPTIMMQRYPGLMPLYIVT